MKKTKIIGIFAVILLLVGIVFAEYKSDENMNMLGNDLYNATNINATNLYQNGNKVLDTTSPVSAYYSTNAGTATTWAGITAISDLYYKVLVDWKNITGEPTHLSNFTDDLDYSDKNVNYSSKAGRVAEIYVNLDNINSTNNVSNNKFLSVMTIGGGWCYQEFVDQDTSCGVIGNGTTSITSYWVNGTSTADGDWTTAGWTVTTNTARRYETYPVPPTADNYSTIRFGWGNSTFHYDINYPIPYSCWQKAQSTNNLSIQTISIGAGASRSALQCLNETNIWVNVQVNDSYGWNYIYESGINWSNVSLQLSWKEQSNSVNYSVYAGTLLGSVENANYSTYAGTLLGSVENANFSTYAGELNKEYTRGINWTQINSGTFPSACPTGTFLTQINHSVTCTSPDTSDYSVNYSSYTGSVEAAKVQKPLWILSSEESNLNVNSSNYWDGLNTPADINAADITDDGTYVTTTGDTMTGNLTMGQNSLSDVGIIGFNSTDGPRIYYNGTHLVIEG